MPDLPVGPLWCPLWGSQHSAPLESSEIWDGVGIRCRSQGRVRGEALELAGVDHSLENVGKAEEHTDVDHGPPLEEDRIRQTHAHGCPKQQALLGSTWLILTWTFSLATMCP